MAGGWEDEVRTLDSAQLRAAARELGGGGFDGPLAGWLDPDDGEELTAVDLVDLIEAMLEQHELDDIDDPDRRGTDLTRVRAAVAKVREERR